MERRRKEGGRKEEEKKTKEGVSKIHWEIDR